MAVRSLLACVLVCAPLLLAADALPRRPFLGAVLNDPQSGGGAVVTRVVPGSSAEAFGLAAGDVLRRIGDREVTSSAQAVELVRGSTTTRPMILVVERGGQPVELRGTFREFPRESLPGSTVSYESVTLEGAPLRTIVTRPRNAGSPRAAVLFIQGISCASIDLPSAAGSDPWTQLVHEVAEAGLVTMRLDKPGAGDSRGPRCAAIDLQTEVAAFRAALSALLRDPAVDPKRVYLFGHSMGGVIAPLLAAEFDLAGVAVYGTIFKGWFEYLVENKRRQMEKDGFGPGDDFAAIDRYARFMARMVWDGMTPAEIEARYPDLKGAVALTTAETFAGRHATFFQQLARIDLPAQWARVSERVLSMHGEFDWVSSRDDHQRLVLWLESKAPGRATFVALPGLDHGFTAHSSLEESYRRFPRGEGDLTRATSQTLLSWIREAVHPRPPQT